MTRKTRETMPRKQHARLMRAVRTGATLTAITIASAALLQAQFRSSDWVTSGFDAQRTAWVRTDNRLNKAAVTKGEFKFLWQTKFDNEARQLNSLTEPVLQDLLIGYRGFKALAFIGGSNDKLFAIDTDLNKPYWTVTLNYAAATGGQPPSSWECPGGLMAAASRRVPLTQPPFNPAGGPGVGRGGRAASAVGEPGKGAAVLATMKPPTPPPPPAAPPAGAKPTPSPTAPTPPPTPAAPPRTGDAAAPASRPSSLTAPVPFGGVDPIVAVGTDGWLRTLRVSDGAEIRPAVPFLPASTKPSSLLFVDGVVYTTTTNGCGATPNAVWSIDLTAPATDTNPNPERKVSSWQTGGADIAGTRGLALGTDGTIYVALGSAPALKPGDPGPASGANHANTVVALDRQTLKVKDWFTAGVPFVTSPVVIRHNDKDLIAAASSDGKVYLLDSASLGGSDHKTPLAVGAAGVGGTNGAGASAAAGAGASASSALAAWDDGTAKWIAAPIGNHIVTFKIAGEGGKMALTQGWQSPSLVSPMAPIVVNGMVMAVSSGEYRGGDATLTAAARAKQSQPAVLYVLDGATGKEMWNSGKTITSFARGGLSAGGGQVYLVTYDHQLYAFGIPMEH
jgi:hypothetical protein